MLRPCRGRIIWAIRVLPARLLLLLFLPDPWNVAGALAALALFGLEVFYFYRRMRGEKVVTGAENLVGAIGKAVEPLDLEGHVRVQASSGKHALPRQYRRERKSGSWRSTT